jgi:tryptophan halogenase
VSYLFPFDGNVAPVAKQFNEQVKARYEKIVDFVKLHYCLTKRTDNSFWTDNVNPATIPESLREKLAMWRCRPPHQLDFITDLEMYPPSSWQYVLYGMEFRTEIHNPRAYAQMEAAQKEFRMIAEVSKRAVADLPTNRALVQHYTLK